MSARRAAAVTVTAVLASLSVVSAAGAQFRAALEAGGASVRYADSVGVTAATVMTSFRVDGGLATAAAMGTLSSLGDGTWSTQGGIAGSVLSPALGFLRAELAADAGGSTHQDGTRTGRYLGRARLHAGARRHGLWVGGGAGQTWDGAFWHQVLEGDLGAWARLGPVVLLGTVSPSTVGDSIRYTDGQAMLRWESRRAELTASAGARSGDALVRGSASTWGSAAATLWLTPELGVVASGGSYPVDYTQGFPGGRYISLALRIAADRAEAAHRPPSIAAPRARSGAAVPRTFVVSTLADGRRAIRLHAPGARRVELMGDFTGWQPAMLARGDGGWWSLVLPLAPGSYQLNVRIDGGAWEVPAGTTPTMDEFGTRVGQVLVR